MSILVGLTIMAMAQGPIETKVTFTGAGGFELYGTLTIPSHAEGKLVPAVLLLPGSGPTDRDGNQPRAQIITNVLRDLSSELASSGIATLRFDKRAAPIYLSKFPKDRNEWADFFKWENFVDDATYAYKFLGKQRGVDFQRIAIVGHSEGAEIALQIGSNLAKSTNPPAALVTIGGAGRPMGPILDEQIERALNKQGALPPIKKQYMEALDRAMAQIVSDGTFPADLPPGLVSLFNATTVKLIRSYLTIDPAVLARNCRGPVLILNGGHDTQISPERDAPKLKAALQSRSSGMVEMLIVPDASHNLKSTTGGDDDNFKGPVAPLAVAKLKQFLTKQLHP